MISVLERIEYSNEDFECIRDIMADICGINLNAAKRELVYSRLAKRVRQLHLNSFKEYCTLIRNNPVELGQCVNAMTTNVTSFFREQHHFDFLNQVVFPERVANASESSPNTVRFWSAGCSSGEEPYSIAMSALEFFGNDPLCSVEIDATDLDSTILERARGGIYRQKDVRGMEPARLHRWFHRGTKSNEGQVRIVPEIRERVTFRALNLKEHWPDRPAYDVIFCRNVMIYFDLDLKRKLIDGFFNMLKPGGYLFVGHSESLFGLSGNFEIVGKTIHKRRQAARDVA